MQSRHLERINELVREKRALLGVNSQLRERNAELERENAWLRRQTEAATRYIDSRPVREFSVLS